MRFPLALVIGVCLALAALSGAASAQGAQPQPEAADTSASQPETVELPAGGLLLVPEERLMLEAEEVVLGRGGVRATYVVGNRATELLTRFVSFALPEIDMAAIGDEIAVLPGADPRNFVGAQITVDGAPVALAFEQRALAYGRDLTALLESGGVPLNPLAQGVEDALRLLPPAQLQELEERGAITRDEDRIIPAWVARTTAYWRQTFEPGKAVTIGLSYAPVTASGVWGAESLARLRDTYCIDRGLEEAIAARLAKSGRGLITHRLTFSMAHNAGLVSPIPRFRLAIEKSGFETLIATCWKDLRAAGPTLLETIRRDFKSEEDVRVLLVQ